METSKRLPEIMGADLYPRVGFPQPEASVFYTEARTVLGPNSHRRYCPYQSPINSRARSLARSMGINAPERAMAEAGFEPATFRL
jgi:hypothetical protein